MARKRRTRRTSLGSGFNRIKSGLSSAYNKVKSFVGSNIGGLLGNAIGVGGTYSTAKAVKNIASGSTLSAPSSFRPVTGGGNIQKAQSTGQYYGAGGGGSSSPSPFRYSGSRSSGGSSTDMTNLNSLYNSSLFAGSSVYNNAISAFSSTPSVNNVGDIGSQGTGGTGGNINLPGYDTQNKPDSTDSYSYLMGDKEKTKADESFYDKEEQRINDYFKEKKGFFDELTANQKTREEEEARIREREGLMQLREHLALKKQKQAEIDAIQGQLNILEQQKQEQIMAISTGPYSATTNFLNNKISAIEWGFNIRANKYIADMKLKTAQLAVMNEDWELAEKYVDDAVDAIMAEDERKYDNAVELMKMNDVWFESLSKTRQNAYNEALDTYRANLAYQRQLATIKYREELGLANKLKEQEGEIENIESYAIAVNEGRMDITDVPSALRGAVDKRTQEIENMEQTQKLRARTFLGGAFSGNTRALNNAGFSNSDIKQVKNYLEEGGTLEQLFKDNDFSSYQKALLEVVVEEV